MISSRSYPKFTGFKSNEYGKQLQKSTARCTLPELHRGEINVREEVAAGG
jgi:hypothetical protein